MTRFVLLLVAAGLVSGEVAAEPRRVALVVGANRPSPGAVPLRYAHRDAQSIADVLVQVAGFATGDVRVMLDPKPEAILAALDADLASLRGTESLLLFYYSGHADAGALYPGGEPLDLALLKERLSSEAATVRIGIIDACRGGGWTQAKGLSAEAPFAVSVPLELTSEGSALIASSSGLEAAHESEELQGSFFTHHLVAGLRGAAAASNDGQVTLGEAYAYARELTIRDTALRAEAPQHPSFDLRLRGRRDLPLARIAEAPAVLEVNETDGPLQVVHLESGLVVLEVRSGRREMKLALPPGRYLVRRRTPEGTFAREFDLAVGGAVHLDEAALELVGSDVLSAKGPRPLALATSVPRGRVELGFAAGLAHSSIDQPGIHVGSGNLGLGLDATWGITDRLEWPILTPALAYRFGEPGGMELVLAGGLASWSFGGPSSGDTSFSYAPEFAAEGRVWLGPRGSLNFGLSGTSFGELGSQHQRPTTWQAKLTMGFTWTLADAVTLNVGLSYRQRVLQEGQLVGASPADRDGAIGLGSVQDFGWRRLPLVQVHVTPRLSLDGYAGYEWSLSSGAFSDTYLGGLTWDW